MWQTVPETDMPANLLVGDGEAFTDMAPDLELDVLGSYRSAVAADHNGDGVLDLLLTQVVDAPRLWLSEGCTEAGWLAVEAPPGSRVTLEVGDRVYSELVTTCSAYGAAGPPEVHFGLGDAAQVDRLEVRLPDGRIGWLESVAPRQRVVVSGE